MFVIYQIEYIIFAGRNYEQQRLNYYTIMKKLRFLIVCVVIVAITSCSKDNGINFFTVNQDIAFGAQLDSTILANPAEYPILSKAQYPEVYNYLEGMLDKILQSPE